MDIFAKRLKWLREKKGMTQKEVAEYMGVSQQYYGRFEKAQGQPNIDGILKLRILFGEELDFLLGYYEFDRHALGLFQIYRQRKRKYGRRQERLQEFFDFMKKENIDDGELKKRLRDLMMFSKESETEKAALEKAKEKFISYLSTIPGAPEPTEQYINELSNYYDQGEETYRTNYLKLIEDIDDEDQKK